MHMLRLCLGRNIENPGTLGYIVKQRPRYGFSQKSDLERPIQDDCRGIHRRGVMPELRLCPGDDFYADVPGQAVLSISGVVDKIGLLKRDRQMSWQADRAQELLLPIDQMADDTLEVVVVLPAPGPNKERPGRKGNHSIDDDLPPPTPPKDNLLAPPNYRFHPPPMHSYSLGVASRSRMDMPERWRSVSEFAIISHHDHDQSWPESDESSVMVECPPSPIVPVPLAGKCNPAETTVIADPAERAPRRLVARRQRELEEAEAAREEEERRTGIRRVKEEQRRVEEQEERDRRTRIERDMRMSTEARRRKKEAEERAEEEKKRELAVRGVREREKRLEEHRRLEQWRAEQARIKEEELRREEAERAKEQAERNKRVEQMAARVKRDKTGSMLAGWATIQTISTSSDKGRAVEGMACREAGCVDVVRGVE
ncbi:uncharacterized protein EV420DRAFT_1678195 [Desarmillaria tabescens]|uniref:Uncharacterized protein n=1 Tax=Armillaria tabescens TaxID=1929756 RepID=A0AA39J719_ARMTA|nr:uncharacterized protein EV420DRAFT_1678195 [Desarmillaria tabescens]KAK0435433.1 hypothetical protein EV420DRAFT_1678195 [Desarmillaria tabescens]